MDARSLRPVRVEPPGRRAPGNPAAAPSTCVSSIRASTTVGRLTAACSPRCIRVARRGLGDVRAAWDTLLTRTGVRLGVGQRRPSWPQSPTTTCGGAESRTPTCPTSCTGGPKSSTRKTLAAFDPTGEPTVRGVPTTCAAPARAAAGHTQPVSPGCSHAGGRSRWPELSSASPPARRMRWRWSWTRSRAVWPAPVAHLR